MLKKLLIGTALAAMAASPALAQSYYPDVGSGNIVAGPGGPHVRAETSPYVGQRGPAYTWLQHRGGVYVRPYAYGGAYGGAYAYAPPRYGSYEGPSWFSTPGDAYYGY